MLISEAAASTRQDLQIVKLVNEIIPSKYKEIDYLWVPALGSRSPRHLNLLLAIFDGLKYFYILPDFRKWTKLPYEEFIESVSVALIIQDPSYS